VQLTFKENKSGNERYLHELICNMQIDHGSVKTPRILQL